MHSTFTRYAVPVGTVAAGIAYAALLITAPFATSSANVTEDVMEDVTESVTESVERSTLPDVTLTNCTSDGPSDDEAPCYWDASENGDGQGHDFILWTDGQVLTPLD